MYINKQPTENGNYGNPRSNGDGLLLPDALMPDYLDSMGFANITHDGTTVLTVERNEEAYSAYKETHPDIPPEAEVTAEEILDTLLGVEE